MVDTLLCCITAALMGTSFLLRVHMARELKLRLSDGKRVGAFSIRGDGMDVFRLHRQIFPPSHQGTAARVMFNSALGIMTNAFFIRILSS